MPHSFSMVLSHRPKIKFSASTLELSPENLRTCKKEIWRTSVRLFRFIMDKEERSLVLFWQEPGDGRS